MKLDTVYQSIMILSFFPSLLFFAFPNNQIQPVYILPCLVFLCYGGIRKSLECKVLLVVLAIAFHYLIFHIFGIRGISFYHLINFASYIAPLILFLAVSSGRYRFKVNTFLVILYFWTAVCLHQMLVPVNAASDAAESIFRFFIADRFSIYRASGGVGSRGASGFTAEPAGAAIVVSLLLVLLRQYINKNLIKGPQKYFSIICAICLVFSNASGTLALLLVIYISIFILINWKYLFFTIFWVAGIVGLGFFNLLPETRFQQIIIELSDNFEFLREIELMYALTFFMGVRVYNWIYSYGSLFDNFGLGHSLMGWNSQGTMDRVISSIGIRPMDFSSYTNITYEGVIIKPYTFLSIWAYDFGLPAIIFLIFFIILILIKTPLRMLPEFMVAVIIILLFPPVTSPTPWIIFALCQKNRREKYVVK